MWDRAGRKRRQPSEFPKCQLAFRAIARQKARLALPAQLPGGRDNLLNDWSAHRALDSSALRRRISQQWHWGNARQSTRIFCERDRMEKISCWHSTRPEGAGAQHRERSIVGLTD